MMQESNSDYDAFAWFFDRHWSVEVQSQILTVIERLLLPLVPRGARLLDLCCGTGQMAAELSARGIEVTGLDVSAQMLCHARAHAPAASFVEADAREFELPARYDAVISTFDSLNHLLTLEDLWRVFRQVHRALAPGGWFLFDVNLEEGFLAHWRDYFSIVEDDNVCVLQGDYDPNQKIGRYDITMFRLHDGTWRRTDAHVTEKCYSLREIKGALKRAGFKDISTFDAETEMGLADHVGRIFFLVRKG